jgi:hypothetical protein
MCAQVSHRSRRRTGRSPSIYKRGKKRVALGPIDKATLLRDRTADNRVMVNQDPRPRRSKLAR